MSALSAIFNAEMRRLSRDRFTLVLGLTLIVLTVFTTVYGLERTQKLEGARSLAQTQDRQIWLDQGEDNPHAAAHFSRYAFKPTPLLAALEPGVSNASGVAIWMEGHYQNPAQFRPIEDTLFGAQTFALSPSFVLIAIGSLSIFIALGPSIAGAREDGILRHTLAAGVSPSSIIWGKLIAALVLVGLAASLTSGLAIVLTLVFSTSITPPDLVWRAIGLAMTYAVFFITITSLALGISALFKTRQDATGALVALWCTVIVIAPQIATGLTANLIPDPDGAATYQRITNASIAYFRDPEARQQALQAALERYGVETQEDLPLRYDGYELQYAEEVAHPLFEAIYADVRNRHSAQERLLTLISIVLPGMAARTATSAFAGTDRAHHDSFADDAEAHRRNIVKQLNDDLAFSDLERETPYQADQSLWVQIPDFEPTMKPLSVSRSVLISTLLILFSQALCALAFAWLSILRAIRRSAQ